MVATGRVRITAAEPAAAPASSLARVVSGVCAAALLSAAVVVAVQRRGDSAGSMAPGASAATADAPVIVGLGAHDLDTASVRLLRAAGVRHVRTTLYWAQWESRPAYRAHVDSAFRRARAAGLALLVVVHQAPLPLDAFGRRDVAFRAYAAFVAARAAQFPGLAWELWNEINAPGWTHLFGSMDGRPPRDVGAQYAAMLRLAYPAIKQADPTAVVVTGGTGGDPREFLRGLLARGPADAPADALGVHIYGADLDVEAARTAGIVREVQRETGDARPVWCTEIGIGTEEMQRAWGRPRPFTAAKLDTVQRDVIARGVDAIVTGRLFPRVYIHALREPDTGGGIVRADWTVRPAYDWLRERLAGR